VDIRSYPGSKRFPHFNKENLSRILSSGKIAYLHMPELGGRRKALPDSHNTAWKHDSFRGYADYMETDPFINAINALIGFAGKKRVAYMCSEAVWWRCHRSLVSDHLKSKGWLVMHIMDTDKYEEHLYTKPARIADNKLVYTEPFFE
jgi:uncharacterized protein (DUF488 family)